MRACVRVSMFVSVSLSVSQCLCVFVCACVRVCVRACVRVQEWANIQELLFWCVCARACVRACVRACMCVCACAGVGRHPGAALLAQPPAPAGPDPPPRLDLGRRLLRGAVFFRDALSLSLVVSLAWRGPFPLPRPGFGRRLLRGARRPRGAFPRPCISLSLVFALVFHDAPPCLILVSRNAFSRRVSYLSRRSLSSFLSRFTIPVFCPARALAAVLSAVRGGEEGGG